METEFLLDFKKVILFYKQKNTFVVAMLPSTVWIPAKTKAIVICHQLCFLSLHFCYHN